MVIAFDIDGTIFDTKKEIISCVNVVLKKMNIQEISSTEAELFVGPSFSHSLTLHRGVSAEQAENITTEFRKIYKHVLTNSKPYIGAEIVLQQLKQNGVSLFVATNKPREQIDSLFEKYNMGHFFDGIYTREKRSDTKANMLKQIKTFFDTDEIFLMVGDTQGDLDAAEAEGYVFIEAGYGYGEFEKTNTYTLNKIEDIIQVVEILKC